MDFARSYPFSLGGGLNLADAPEVIEDSQAIELVNVRFPGARRWAPRRAAALVADGLTNVCGIHGMPHGTDTADGSPNGGVYLDWTGVGVRLWAADGTGRNKAFVGFVAGWEVTSHAPKSIAAVAGGCLWIVDEDKELGLTVYDPDERFGAGKLFQPTFKFDVASGIANSAIKARCVAAYNNFLFVAGYGTEVEPDRPEIVRFSYLGFEADTEGSADAGVVGSLWPGDPGYAAALPTTPGSKGLFDVDDYFYLGVRGQPVMAMVAAAERLLLLTRFTAHQLFGYDRFSFDANLIDNARGVVASRAAGEGNGSAWWWSPLGPCAWSGGAITALEREITPRIRNISHDSMFFAHQHDEYEVRWYHSIDTAAPNRAICFNYLYEAWKEEELGLRVSCAGNFQPGTLLRPGPVLPPIEPPPPDPSDPPPPGTSVIPAPTGLFHDELSSNSARARWTPGIVASNIATLVFIKKDGGLYVPVQPGSGFTLFPGQAIASSSTVWLHTNLTPSTLYWTKVQHIEPSTGRLSLPIEAPFPTFAAIGDDPEGPLPVGAPAIIGVTLVRYTFEGNINVWATLRWALGAVGLYSQIQYKPQGATWATAFNIRAGVNVTSWQISGTPSGGFFNLASGLWTFRVRHTTTPTYDEVLSPSGRASAWSSEVTANMASAV